MIESGRRKVLKGGLALLGTAALCDSTVFGAEHAAAQKKSARSNLAANTAACACEHAADGTPLDFSSSELRPMIERYGADLDDLNRVYSQHGSALRKTKLDEFYSRQMQLLEAVNFDALSQDGKVDFTLLRNHIEHQQQGMIAEDKQNAEIAPMIPYQADIIELEDARRRMETMDAQKAADVLVRILGEIPKEQSAIPTPKPDARVLARAATRVNELRDTLRWWYNFYDLYDPDFAWWMEGVYKPVDAALYQHLRTLLLAAGITPPPENTQPEGNGRLQWERSRSREFMPPEEHGDLSGVGPAGRDAIVEALRYNMVAYTPEDLIVIANKEFAWCDREMLRASHEMGFGDEWKKALEKVKNDYVAPGKMIYLVRDQEKEALAFVDAHDLVTIPPLCRQDWWEEAMTPRMQLVNPFFTGGDDIHVSSPASSMTDEDRLESMRGNNIYFSRGTVFHELIPGHHMQFYMLARYRPYRRPFDTAFWIEGMAFYWEMLMWDLGYDRTPEERIGVLFWRMHRCARIIFSLNFHLGKWTAQQCVDFLIDRVGHERANAEGEVRRSFNGSYEPIYQCAYMLGALQFHALHKELVDSGKMTNRAFHDAIFMQSSMPIEMVRAAVANAPLERNHEPSWKFYGPISG